jgi:hypothetical protein
MNKITVTSRNPLPTRTRAQQIGEDIHRRIEALCEQEGNTLIDRGMLRPGSPFRSLIEVFAAQFAAMEDQIEALADELAYKVDAEDDDEGDSWRDAVSDLANPRVRLSDHVNITITQVPAPPSESYGTGSPLMDRELVRLDAEMRKSVFDKLDRAQYIVGVDPGFDPHDVPSESHAFDAAVYGAYGQHVGDMMLGREPWLPAGVEVTELTADERAQLIARYEADCATFRDTLNRHTHPTGAGAGSLPYDRHAAIMVQEAVAAEAAATPPPCYGKLGCGVCVACRRYKGEPVDG